jgi:RNA polymerase sigma-70 factor (ECF subfamily)
VSTSSFEDLRARLRAGDPVAVEETFTRYVRRLAVLVRVRLSAHLRQKIDPEDVTQSAFASFFRRVRNDQLELRDWEGVWAILALLTLRKLGHQIEHFQAARRDLHREVPVAALSPDSSASWVQIAREPTPAEAAVLTETVEQVLDKLKDREKLIFLLGLQGYSAAEISTEVGRSERTVYRVLSYIKEELERARADEAPAPKTPSFP